jgi:AraC-like DNA-binding protein
METIPFREHKWEVIIQVTHLLNTMPRLSMVGGGVAYDARYKCMGRFRSKHFHAIFQYTTAGRGVFIGKNDERVDLTPGVGFLCMANDPETNYIYPEDAKEPWEFIFISVHGMREVINELTSRFGHIWQLPMDHPILHWIRGFARYGQTQIQMNQGRVSREVYSFFGDLLEFRLKDEAPRRAEEIVRQAQNLIHDSEGMASVTDIAGRLGISREHLARSFQEVRGVSPAKAIADQKIARASSLLRETDLSCRDIAKRLGYEDAGHFTRMFKRNTGINPLRFRKSFQS